MSQFGHLILTDESTVREVCSTESCRSRQEPASSILILVQPVAAAVVER